MLAPDARRTLLGQRRSAPGMTVPVGHIRKVIGYVPTLVTVG
jgi:hypothetical protein